MAVKKSPVRRGIGSLRGGGESPYLGFEDGDSINVTPLIAIDDMPSIDQHAIWLETGGSPIFPCIKGTGEQCPGCQLENDARFRAFLPVDTSDGQKIWAFGITVARQLAEIDETIGGIGGKVLRVKRSGVGLSTRYNVVYTGRSSDIGDVEVLDVEEHLGPMTRETILELLSGAGVEIDGILSKAEAKKFSGSEDAPAPKGKKPKSEPADDEEDEGWDEV